MDKYRLMAKEYGRNFIAHCRTCCNCQKHPENPRAHCCIAFGVMPGVDCTWDPDRPGGCGLYNRPFKALRPRRAPLVEVYGPRDRGVEGQDAEQISLF